MENSKLYEAHLAAHFIARSLVAAHDYHSFSKHGDEQTKHSGQIWVNGSVDGATKELATLAGYFGFDLVEREELTKQDEA